MRACKWTAPSSSSKTRLGFGGGGGVGGGREHYYLQHVENRRHKSHEDARESRGVVVVIENEVLGVAVRRVEVAESCLPME